MWGHRKVAYVLRIHQHSVNIIKPDGLGRHLQSSEYREAGPLAEPPSGMDGGGARCLPLAAQKKLSRGL